MGFCDDNTFFADKKLNCEYSGPPKAATEDQLQILQQICPHLVEEVALDEMTPTSQIMKISLPEHKLSLITKRDNKDDDDGDLKKPFAGSNRRSLLQLFPTD